MKLFNVYPLYDIEIVRADGATLWDSKGDTYLDLYGGHAVISIGHTHPYYVQKISEQLNTLGFYSNSVKLPIQYELAEKLGAVSGKPDYTLFLCNSGAEANENALKLASFTNGRKKIISFKGSFHGRTSLAVAATDNPSIIAPVNATDNIIFLPFNDEAALEATFAQQGQEITAVIIEGIQGVGGINVASDEFLRKIRTLCDQYGAYYIADSVQCGYGRSGQFFSHDHAGVSADIYTMAKGMGNGFPVAGIAISPKFEAKYGSLGTTFGGNPLACAAAIAVLDVIAKDRLVDYAGKLGAEIMAELRGIKGVKEVRGRGLMIGIEFEYPIEELRKKLLFTHRMFTGNASNKNVIRLLPALNIEKAHLYKFVEALRTEAK
ncbi:MAG TPA: aminotransferase class III-fold pyridoxal phosphate-dependent enzyme [Cytophagales bacterium]|nr:aminotransferase class III-fold pyridoxal phosphate-dependent enzyme [Cytophagales bacterium]